ncbi:arginine--tRNA ligase, partial [Candidatus Gottesmanbacteria bacterium RBG_13_37_7]
QKEDLLKKFMAEDKSSLISQLRGLVYHTVSNLYGKEMPNFNIYEVQLAHPKREDYGDYTTNIALILAGRLKKQSREIAENICLRLNDSIRKHQKISHIPYNISHKDLNRGSIEVLEKCNIAGSGFINMWLSHNYLSSYIMGLLNQEKTVKSTQSPNILPSPLTGKKIMVEYTDPNPFKEFHIGHLYSNGVGESLSRLLESLGADVKRADYFGDVGMHVAKSIWGMKQKHTTHNPQLTTGLVLRELEKRTLSERMRFLGECYTLGASTYEVESEAKEEMKDINYLVYIVAQEYVREKYGFEPQINYRKYVKVDKDMLVMIRELFVHGREWSMEYFKAICKRMGTVFDYFYPESMVGEIGTKLVWDNVKKSIFEESEGAVVFRADAYGLHTRVFINALGLPTYEAKEMGLAPSKFRDFPYDLSINVTGNEINEYFQVVMTAFSFINPDLWKKTKHLGHGMVRLPEGKMSSRTGKILTGEELLEEVKKKIYNILQKSEIKYKKKEQEDIAEKAAIAAVKYSLLKVGLPSDIIFDIEKSVSFEGESGPYLMYTHARCRSVLRKAQNNETMKQCNNVTMKGNINTLQFNPEELAVLRTLYRFPEVVVEATKNLSPSVLCAYLFDLSQRYNLFYDKHPILKPRNRQQATDNRQQSFSSDGGEATTSTPRTVERLKQNLPLQNSMEESDVINFRLALTEATAIVLKKGLYLLGIAAVERM